MTARRDELADGLARVRARIADACQAAGRPVSEVTLVVVTKFFPADDVLELHGLGVRDFGENRDQEAGPKFRQVRDQLGAAGARDDVTLHFVGQLQTNKARHVAAYADVVHSVDRARLVEALDRGAHAAGRRLGVLLQVSLDGTTGRGGVLPQHVDDLAADVASRDLLRLCGVMAVAPRGMDPDASFARLEEVAGGIRDHHPEAGWISAGMSGDLEAAIRHGATHLRVGTAILGSRPTLR
ncbi:MAG TPA: YggS family pyridoxal phosphate-dependent enzyme [Intrasporangium sp.]|uniref:YggS family pyridoxal phosphate-dependent enzyme n=1 Tax=Intrasporangium sp. TaxID=1925024 RepID=UPI002D76D8EB|nr:YggS family pyridoxal phosphate-dependent enzyme [Intrasporangium sp.]HET7398521.1 YggS family pyridoxal phosphate-dependent enzyme [Intrasporangium sp.]